MSEWEYKIQLVHTVVEVLMQPLREVDRDGIHGTMVKNWATADTR